MDTPSSSSIDRIDSAFASRPSFRGSKLELLWDDPRLEVANFGFYPEEHALRRLPERAQQVVSERVWTLAQHTAGGVIRFATDADTIDLAGELAFPPSLPHMAQSGSSGVDLYLYDETEKRWRFAAGGSSAFGEMKFEFRLFDAPCKGVMRDYLLNLPLYNGIHSLNFCFNSGASFRTPRPWRDLRPIVFYGTSITQGACASRPGLAFTNTLCRRLQQPVINLGFSGNGRGEPEVVELVAAIEKPALFVLDYEGNCLSLEHLTSSLEYFLRFLREKHADTPILVAGRIPFAGESELVAAPEQKNSRVTRLICVRAVSNLIAALQAEGINGITYVDGADLLPGASDDCTVDGIHPNDEGFFRLSGCFEQIIRKLLAKECNAS